MILEKYKPSQRDTWTWRFAELTDVNELQELISSQSRFEVSGIFSVEDDLMIKKLSIGIVEQNYNKLGEQLLVATDNTSKKIIAFSWLTRGHWPMYSSMEYAEGVIVELDQSISNRIKITLLAQIIQQNELWCRICGIPVLTANTLRHKQSGFLKLYQQAGFIIRGSLAYLKIKWETT